MQHFHHCKLPGNSTLLSGRIPRDEIGFVSERLQIWFNNTEEKWVDSMPHAHQESDECFIVLQGSLIVDVEGEQFTIGPREFCCFPQGVYHQVIDVSTPAETLMIRSPSVDDKIYQSSQAHSERE